MDMNMYSKGCENMHKRLRIHIWMNILIDFFDFQTEPELFQSGENGQFGDDEYYITPDGRRIPMREWLQGKEKKVSL